MTEEIFNRGINRERDIWDPFAYNGPFSVQMTGDRTVIFGLYAACYNHGFDYLDDISTEDLQRLLDAYNANMSVLTNEEQILTLEIAAKEYVKNIEVQIKQTALETRREKIAADETETDTKIAALEADREELTTLQVRIDMAVDEANLKIKDLEQKIDLESVNQQMIEMEKSEKELAELRTEQRVLLAAQEALEIQLAIVEAGIEESRLNVRVKTTQADIARMKADIASRELTEKELEIDETELDTLEYITTEVRAAKQALQQARKDTINNSISDAADAENEAEDLSTARIQEAIERISARKAALDVSLTSAQMTHTIHEAADDTREEIAGLDADSRQAVAEERTRLEDQRKALAWYDMDTAIDAARSLASANIVNTLTHQLGS